MSKASKNTPATPTPTATTTTATTTVVVAPRVGGIEEGQAWVGGSNVKASVEPAGTLCSRPSNPTEKRKAETILREGLPEGLRLQATDTSVTVWMRHVRRAIEDKGYDSIFRIVLANQSEVYMLVEWGRLTAEDVRNWIKALQDGTAPWPNGNNNNNNGVCKYDIQNLRLSAMTIRSSISTTLLNTIESMVSFEASGPEILQAILSLTSAMTPERYRKIEDALRKLCISSTPQEDVIKHSAKVMDLCNQLVAGPSPSKDLAYLAVKTYQRTTDDLFKMQVLMRLTVEQQAMTPMNYISVCADFNSFYNQRPADDWGPNQSGPSKREAQEHGLVAKYKPPGITNPPATTPPANPPTQRTSPLPADFDRTKGPAEGSPTEIVLNGIRVVWCPKCLRGKGLWSYGDRAHTGSEHKNGFRRKKNAQDDGSQATTIPTSNITGVSGLAVTYLGSEVHVPVIAPIVETPPLSYREVVALRDDPTSMLIGQANAAFYGGVTDGTDGLDTDMFLEGMDDLFEEHVPPSQNTEAFSGMAVLHSEMELDYLEDDNKENIPELVEPPIEEETSFVEPEDRSVRYDVMENYGGDSVPSAIYDPEEQLDDEATEAEPIVRPGLFDSDSDDDEEPEPTARPGLFDSDSDDDEVLETPTNIPTIVSAAPTPKGLLKPSTYVMPGVDNIDYDRLTIDDEVELEGDDGIPVVFTPMGFLDPTTRFEHMNEYGFVDASASKRHFDVESPKEYELKLKYRKMSMEAASPAENEEGPYELKVEDASSGKAPDGTY